MSLLPGASTPAPVGGDGPGLAIALAGPTPSAVTQGPNQPRRKMQIALDDSGIPVVNGRAMPALPLQGYRYFPNKVQEQMFVAYAHAGVLAMMAYDDQAVSRIVHPGAAGKYAPKEALTVHLLRAFDTQDYEAVVQSVVPAAPVFPITIQAFVPTAGRGGLFPLIEFNLASAFTVPLSDMEFTMQWNLPAAAAGALDVSVAAGTPDTMQQPQIQYTTQKFRVEFPRIQALSAEQSQRQTSFYLIPYFEPRPGTFYQAPAFVSASGAASPIPLQMNLTAAAPGLSIQMRGLAADSDVIQSIIAGLRADQ